MKSFSRRLLNSFQIEGDDDADEMFLRTNSCVFLLDFLIFFWTAIRVQTRMNTPRDQPFFIKRSLEKYSYGHIVTLRRFGKSQ